MKVVLSWLVVPYFYNNWPQRINDNWLAFGGGANIWTYYTAIALKDSGYSVKITTEFPEKGIVLSHSRYLPALIKPKQDRLVVCIRADYGRKYSADIHVVQNQYQLKNRGREFLEFFFCPGPNYYIPYWSQPGLIPRDSSRKDTFENIAFMGASQNLHPDFKSAKWEKLLSSEGFNFIKIFERHLWHDYSEVDAILAIRPKKGDHHSRKPPSKLTNAWLAGVPAILGADSAFREISRTDYDYMEISNSEEAFRAILRLRDDKIMRRKIIQNGVERSYEYTQKINLKRWVDFFDNFCIPFYKDRVGWSSFKFYIYKVIKLLRMKIRNV